MRCIPCPACNGTGGEYADPTLGDGPPGTETWEPCPRCDRGCIAAHQEHTNAA